MEDLSSEQQSFRALECLNECCGVWQQAPEGSTAPDL
jgi:hypothetical protein